MSDGHIDDPPRGDELTRSGSCAAEVARRWSGIHNFAPLIGFFARAGAGYRPIVAGLIAYSSARTVAL